MANDLMLTPVLASDARFRLFSDLSKRFFELDYSQLLVYLIDSVDPSALYLLGDQFSVLGDDGWLLAESNDQKRDLIKTAIELHRYKGTPWAIREVIRRLGFGEVEIIEGLGNFNYDGRYQYNGYKVYGGDETVWAVYRVILLTEPITNDQATLLRRVLKSFAPARCHLESLDYQSVPLRYNGEAFYEGNYNFGSA